MIRKRADILLVEKDLASSRQRAKRTILEGEVYIEGKKVKKPSDKFLETLDIEVRTNPLKYVSRAGLKLEKAMEEFHINLNGKTAIDIGSSTGGFTQCMLRDGAKKVYAIDVGKDQLVAELKDDNRVVVMEETNIKDVSRDQFSEEIDFISIDVSFISLNIVLPIAYKLLKTNGELISLIKPQFEVGKDNIGRKGIVKDKKLHLSVLKNIINISTDLGFEFKGLTFSPVTGAKGNIEFLIYLKKQKVQEEVKYAIISKVLEDAYKSLY